MSPLRQPLRLEVTWGLGGTPELEPPAVSLGLWWQHLVPVTGGSSPSSPATTTRFARPIRKLVGEADNATSRKEKATRNGYELLRSVQPSCSPDSPPGRGSTGGGWGLGSALLREGPLPPGLEGCRGGLPKCAAIQRT